MIIDPPSPFAPDSEWRDFLKELEELAEVHPDNDDVKDYIEQAREQLK